MVEMMIGENCNVRYLNTLYRPGAEEETRLRDIQVKLSKVPAELAYEHRDKPMKFYYISVSKIRFHKLMRKQVHLVLDDNGKAETPRLLLFHQCHSENPQDCS
mgnify:CR=1 FL=1